MISTIRKAFSCYSYVSEGELGGTVVDLAKGFKKITSATDKGDNRFCW